MAGKFFGVRSNFFLLQWVAVGLQGVWEHYRVQRGFIPEFGLRGWFKDKLIIVDDLISEVSSLGALANLFTKGSHHNNCSVMFNTQNVFNQGTGQSDISLNAYYSVVFQNLWDRAQIRHLSRRIYPDDPLFLQKAYHNVTFEPFVYLLLDFKQNTPENCRFRTGIFPDDNYHYVYVSKKKKAINIDSKNTVSALTL